MSIMAYMQSQVLTDPECVDPTREAKRKKSKTKMTMGESIKFLGNANLRVNCFDCLFIHFRL